MSTSKHINIICIAIVIFSLILTIFYINGEALGIACATRVQGYESRLFSTDTVHKIDIVMNDWDSFIEGCEDEEYSSCSVVIDGDKSKNVGIRAKGNTSLSTVKSMDSERYSFKIEFDHYEKGKNYYGLDKLCLNNLIQDNTMMKDYLVYQMMNDFGVDSPLCSFVYITVNGEDWGLYLAVEGIEDSFLERNYGSESGDLYKPDSMSFGGGKGNGRDFNMNDSDGENTNDSEKSNNSQNNQNGNMQPPQMSNDSNTPQMGSPPQNGNNFKNGGTPPQMPQNADNQTQGGDSQQNGNKPEGGNAGPNNGSDDVKLKYTDDSEDSYSNIFDNAKTKATEADKKRLISSIKNLSEYTDLENTVDIDKVLRYFVVHNFVCNGDSYTGSMIHNYYLYETDGILSMIPWDYNLAFGTFQGNNASDSVNTSIDNPITGGNVDDRPMFGWIFSDENYTNKYHELFLDFIENWFSNDKLEQIISDTADLIRSYVQSDPTKFCTEEEFETGVKTITQYVTLRFKAVSRQLEGNTDTVDTGTLNLSDMGTMNNGMGQGNFGGMNGNADFSSMISITDKDGKEVDLSSIVQDITTISKIMLSDGTSVNVDNFDMKNMMDIDTSKITSIIDKAGNTIDVSKYTISLKSPQQNQAGGNNQFGQPQMPNNSNSSTDSDSDNIKDNQGNGNMQTSPGNGNDGMNANEQVRNPNNDLSQTSSSSLTIWIFVGISIVILGLGIIVVVKKKY